MPAEKPIIFTPEMVRAIFEGRKTHDRRVVSEPVDLKSKPCTCRYQPGDLLWVKEAFDHYESGDDSDIAEAVVFYKADFLKKPPEWYKPDLAKWRNPVVMPKRYARLWLRVTDVQCERLQDITEDDADAEGYQSVDFLESAIRDALTNLNDVDAAIADCREKANRPGASLAVLEQRVQQITDDLRNL